MSSQHRHSSARSVLLHERARVMRAQPTPSEARLWAQLSGRKLGVAFRRQVVLGEYIVDVLAPAYRLVVEVDGAYHAGRGPADARRDARLEALGYRVLHLDAELVMHVHPRCARRERSVAPIITGQVRRVPCFVHADDRSTTSPCSSERGAARCNPSPIPYGARPSRWTTRHRQTEYPARLSRHTNPDRPCRWDNMPRNRAAGRLPSPKGSA